MKQRVIICIAAFLPLLVIGCESGGANTASTNTPANTAPASSSNAAPVDKKAATDEARALLAAHDKALGEKNLDAVLATFASDAVVLGTGIEERWIGQQEIKTAYTEMLKDYDPNTFEANCDWKTGGVDDAGTMAWFAAACSCKDSLAGKAREYKLNVSAGLAKKDGKWHFAMLHMSNAFQPPAAK